MLPGGLATTHYAPHRQGDLSTWLIHGIDNRDSPSRQGTLFVSHADHTATARGSGSESGAAEPVSTKVHSGNVAERCDVGERVALNHE